jgi:uncharacterized protein
MRTAFDIFHLAIGVHDLNEAQDFYVTKLGCKLARRYDDRITLDFFGDQVVCHLTEADGPPPAPKSLYPHHFGVTFHDPAAFEALYACAAIRKIPVYRDVVTRFEGMAEEHRTFVLIDPSGNLLEFKHYRDPRMMY